MKQYHDLLKHILDSGTWKERNATTKQAMLAAKKSRTTKYKNVKEMIAFLNK